MRLPHIWHIIVPFLLQANLSLQQAKDPIQDFCRRWGHQTAVVDNRLYIDGGLVDWNPISQNPLNYTNTWLLYQDLDIENDGFPQIYANLSKNSTIPDVSGGTLWADEVNKVLYLFGGQWQDNPNPMSFWLYDILLNQWNQSSASLASLDQVAYGAGTVVDERGEGYYLGGYLSNQTNPQWTGPPYATSALITYDMDGNFFTNNTGPDNTGRAEGALVFLSASDNGLLVYFGGSEDTSNNGTMTPADMSKILVYDINSQKWYTQTASGQVPQSRKRFCAGATMADDRSSYNIYLYGGYGFEANETAFDDVYILSLPSFTWIQWYEALPGQGRPHGDLSCNVIDGSQMLIIGGWFPAANDTGCDSANVWGTHNLNLGQNGPADAEWDLFYPNITSYDVPPTIVSAVGGGPTGGATMRAPSGGFDNEDLSVYFTRTPSFKSRTATRAITATAGASSPSTAPNKSSTNVGAIVGGVVGGVAGLILLVVLGLCCFRRRKNGTPKPRRESVRHELADTQAPVEAGSIPVYHEPKSPMSHMPSGASYRTSPDPYATGPYYQQVPPQSPTQHPAGYYNEHHMQQVPPPNWQQPQQQQQQQLYYAQQQQQHQQQYDPNQDIMRQQHYPPPPEEIEPPRSPPTVTSTPAHFYPHGIRPSPHGTVSTVTGSSGTQRSGRSGRSPQPGYGKFIEEEDGYDYRD